MIAHVEVITPLRRLIALLVGLVLTLAAVVSSPASAATPARLGALLGDPTSTATTTTFTVYDAAAQHSSATSDEHGVAGTAIRASARAPGASWEAPALPALDFVAAETATGTGPRFITNAAGDTLDTIRITIPEGKFGYLLKGSSKSGVFSDSMGFDQSSLDSALRTISSTTSAVLRSPCR